MSNSQPKKQSMREIKIPLRYKSALGSHAIETGTTEGHHIRAALEAFSNMEPSNAHRALLELKGECLRKNIPIGSERWEELRQRKKRYGLNINEQVEIALALYFGELPEVEVAEADAPANANDSIGVKTPLVEHSEILVKIEEIQKAVSQFAGADFVGRAVGVATSEPVELELLMEVSCGKTMEMHEMADCMGEARKFCFEGALARKVTPHSFVARANGHSMYNECYPDSISPGDMLLMTPFHECNFDVETGVIILAELEFADGVKRYTLKEYVGKKLRANNPEYSDIEFAPEIKCARVYAVCRGVVERVFL